MKTKEHFEEHDKQLRAGQNLVHRGMELVGKNGQDIRKLTAAQKRTDAALKALIDGLRAGGNGRGNGKN